jgi:uncharacterized BrkB/YihY/UPF0761 family membrane protein
MLRRMTTSGSFAMARKIGRAIHEDTVYDTAAGLAYYALLALVPFLLLCILLVGLVLDVQSPETIARIVALAGFNAESGLLPETIQETNHGLASWCCFCGRGFRASPCSAEPWSIACERR